MAKAAQDWDTRSVHKLGAWLVRSRAVERGSGRVVAVAALAIAVGAPVSAAGDGNSVGDLRTREAQLAARSNAVLARLSLLERRLVAARTQLNRVRERAAELGRRRADVARHLHLAREDVRAAQRGLARRLRALYVSSGPEPLAVLLGARSLGDAMVAIDGLEFEARHDTQLVARTREARARLRRLRATLARRAAELRRVQAAAAAQAAALAQARDAKAAYLATLRAEQRLTAARIAALHRRALAAAAHVPATPAAVTPVLTTARALTVVASGYSLRGTTATGTSAGWGVVAVDPGVIPLGTAMTIPGYGRGVAADVGAAVSGAKIDLWFPSEQEARAWGRRTVTVTLGSGDASE